MMGILIVIAVVLILILIAVIIKKRKNTSKVEQNTNNVPDPLYEKAKADMAAYINQSLKKMTYNHRHGKWRQLRFLGIPNENTMNYIDKMTDELKPDSARLLRDFLGCIDITKKQQDENEVKQKEGLITDPRKLMTVFLSMMLPFYPLYCRELFTVRYNALIDEKTLDLFRQLTGKRYRLGYKNLHKSGQVAFEYVDRKYRVYDDKGEMLCDASFKDGTPFDGYAQIRDKKASGRDWEIIKKGVYKKGIFTENVVYYNYRKQI